MRKRWLYAAALSVAVSTMGPVGPGPSAFAAGESGQIVLRAVVPVVCTVAVTETNTTVNIVQGQTAVPVASVQEQCNSAAGYAVTITSRNGGQLRRDGTTEGVGYTLHYGGASGTGTILTDRTVAADGRSAVLAVTVPATRDAQAGDYSDVVTIAVSAK